MFGTASFALQLHRAASPLRASGYGWSLENEEMTNPPGLSCAPGTEMPDLGRSCRKELSFAILCKGKHKPNPSWWEEKEKPRGMK